MPEEPLDYEQMLSELLGLVGQTVIVTIDMRFARTRRPLASFFGELKRGKEADLAPLIEPGEEAILLYVGDGFFVMRKDDFKRGRRDGSVLAFEAGKARFVVSR